MLDKRIAAPACADHVLVKNVAHIAADNGQTDIFGQAGVLKETVIALCIRGPPIGPLVQIRKLDTKIAACSESSLLLSPIKV